MMPGRGTGWALALVAAWATAGHAQETGRVAAELAPREITVGDAAVATLHVFLPAGAATDLSLPDWSKGWGDAEVLASNPGVSRSAAGGSEVRLELRITAFKTGEIALPAIDLGCADPNPEWCRTPADLRLTVRSVLPATPAGESPPAPRPAQPPRPLAVPATFWWATVALALACAAAAIAVARRRPATAAGPAAPVQPPLPELLDALATLVALDPIAGAQRLSTAFRRYLGRVFRFPAVESSTSEIHRQLLGRALEPALVRRGVQLLRDCDQVKFARKPFGRDDLGQQVAIARELAAGVERHLAPPAPPAPLKVPA
ncbi:MAG: hypothetical protein U0X73_18995 [Thermoanaerobaculia bacterium]